MNPSDVGLWLCRLAEEIEPSASGSLGMINLTGSPHLETLTGGLQGRNEEDVFNTVGATTNPEADEEELLSTSGKTQKNGGGDAAFGWHRQVHSNAGGNCQKSSRKDLVLTAVANAFKAYEEFLKQTCKGSPHPPIHAVNTNSIPNHNLVDSVNNKSIEGECSLLVKESSAETAGESPDMALITHLETCLVWNTQRLLRVLPSVFRYLPHLATGSEEIILLLVSNVDPVELFNYEFRLTLGEFSVMGNQSESLARLTKASLSWEFVEQQYFWRLMGAELQAGPPSTTLQVSLCIITSNRGFLALLNCLLSL